MMDMRIIRSLPFGSTFPKGLKRRFPKVSNAIRSFWNPRTNPSSIETFSMDFPHAASLWGIQAD